MKLERVVIRANDYRKSFEFYHDTLGLRLKSSWQRSDSWGALFFLGELLMEIIWFPDGPDSDACNYIPEHSKTELFLQVSNVDALHTRLSDHPDLKISGLENKPWGYRQFDLYDPDHVKIIFAQPI
jgi:catechol 2,3-dioxygenase-like lactoylglutathione lyase family enzyme